MRCDRVETALSETMRFVERVAALKKAWKDREYDYPASRESAAVRRASLDLSAALAAMRRSR